MTPSLKEVPTLQITSQQQQQQHRRASEGQLEALVGAVAVQIGPVLYSASADGGRILLGRWASSSIDAPCRQERPLRPSTMPPLLSSQEATCHHTHSRLPATAVSVLPVDHLDAHSSSSQLSGAKLQTKQSPVLRPSSSSLHTAG